MKIYLFYYESYEGDVILLGVFSTLEKAEQAKKEYLSKYMLVKLYIEEEYLDKIINQ